MRNPNIVFLKPLENVKIRIVAIGRETLVKNDCPLFFLYVRRLRIIKKNCLDKVGKIPLFVIDFDRNSISFFCLSSDSFTVALSDFFEISTTTITTSKMATEMILKLRYGDMVECFYIYRLQYRNQLIRILKIAISQGCLFSVGRSLNFGSLTVYVVVDIWAGLTPFSMNICITLSARRDAKSRLCSSEP